MASLYGVSLYDVCVWGHVWGQVFRYHIQEQLTDNHYAIMKDLTPAFDPASGVLELI